MFNAMTAIVQRLSMLASAPRRKLGLKFAPIGYTSNHDTYLIMMLSGSWYVNVVVLRRTLEVITILFPGTPLQLHSMLA